MNSDELTPEAIRQLPPGADLDALVAEYVLGWGQWLWAETGRKWCWGQNAPAIVHGQPWNPSTNAATFWLIVQHLELRDAWKFQLQSRTERWVAAFVKIGVDSKGRGESRSNKLYVQTRPIDLSLCFWAEAEGETPWLAACRAALLAVRCPETRRVPLHRLKLTARPTVTYRT